jgi:hypothetical protein
MNMICPRLSTPLARPAQRAEFAQPDRVPASLQTRRWRDELVASLGGTHVGDRHRALLTLGGWDPDPRVAAAMRRLLASDDVMEAGMAATGLAGQGDLADLPSILDLVRRFSPVEGGSTDAMLLPLRAAIELAAQDGPGIVIRVRAFAREWRGVPKRRRRSWEGQADALLDEILDDTSAPHQP